MSWRKRAVMREMPVAIPVGLSICAVTKRTAGKRIGEGIRWTAKSSAEWGHGGRFAHDCRRCLERRWLEERGFGHLRLPGGWFGRESPMIGRGAKPAGCTSIAKAGLGGEQRCDLVRRQRHRPRILWRNGHLEQGRADPVDLEERDGRLPAVQDPFQDFVSNVQWLRGGELRWPCNIRREHEQDVSHGETRSGATRRRKGTEWGSHRLPRRFAAVCCLENHASEGIGG